MKHLKASLLMTISLCLPNIWAADDNRSICHSSGTDPRLDEAWATIEASSNTTHLALGRHRENLEHLRNICLAYRASTPQEFQIPLGVFEVPVINGGRRINNNGELEVLEQVRIIKHFPCEFSRHLPEGLSDSSFLFVMEVLLCGATASPRDGSVQRTEVRNIVGNPEIAAAINEQAEYVKESEQDLLEAIESAEKAREYFCLLKPLIMALNMIPSDEQSVRETLMKNASNELATIIKSMLHEGLLNPAVISEELERLKTAEQETGLALKLALDSKEGIRISAAHDDSNKASIERAKFQYDFIKLLAPDRDNVFEKEGAESLSSDIDQHAKIAEYEKLREYAHSLWDILESAKNFEDEAMVSLAEDHFFKAAKERNALEVYIYPGRLRIQIKNNDHECFIWGRRMQALRQMKAIADENYGCKADYLCDMYPSISPAYRTEEQAIAVVKEVYLNGSITSEQETEIRDLFHLMRVRDKVSESYSEAFNKWQCIKNDLLKLTHQYREAFPNALIRLTSQLVLDEEEEREAIAYAKMYAAKEAAKAAWDLQEEQKRKANADAYAAEEAWKSYQQATESDREPSEASDDVGEDPVSLALSTNEYGLSAEQQEFIDSFYRLHNEWIAVNEALRSAYYSENQPLVSELEKIQDNLGRTCLSKFDEYYFKYLNGKSLNQLFGSEEGLNKALERYSKAYSENRESLEAAEKAGDLTTVEDARKKTFVLEFLLGCMNKFRDNIDNPSENSDLDESRSPGFEPDTVISLLADLRLPVERQVALDALYDLFRKQDQDALEGSDADTAKNEYETGKAEFYHQYFSSDEGQEPTAEKLIDLEQKIQYLNEAFDATCQAFANARVIINNEAQELAISRNGWSLSFLRNLYEQHYERLKGYLDALSATIANAAAEEGSDDEWAAGALVEDGVMAELNAISQADLDLTNEQQATLKELFDISMRAAALERSLASAARARDVAEMTRLRGRLAAAERAEEEARNKYNKEYIYSPQGMLRTPSKLEDLQQKIQYLKNLHERAERLLGKISSQDGIQTDALASKFYSMGFLIRLYEQHYSMLKDFLEKNPPIMPVAAVEESSDDERDEAPVPVTDGGAVAASLAGEQANPEEDRLWNILLQTKKELQACEARGNEEEIAAANKRVISARSAWYSARNNNALNV